MMCPNRKCDQVLTLFRMGRAHYVCIECGHDVTLHLVCLREIGVRLDGLTTLTPEDFKP